MKFILAFIFCLIWEATVAEENPYIDRKFGVKVKGQSLISSRYFFVEAPENGQVEANMNYPNYSDKKTYFEITQIVIRDFNTQSNALIVPEPGTRIGKLRAGFKFLSHQAERLHFHVFIFGIYIGPCIAEKAKYEL